MGQSYNDLHMDTIKEKMIRLNEEYEKTKLLNEFKKWVSIQDNQLTYQSGQDTVSLPMDKSHGCFFLVADTQLCKRLCPSIRWSVHRLWGSS